MQDLFDLQKQRKEERKRQEKRRFVLSYVADKWIDFLALVIAIIALIRTF